MILETRLPWPVSVNDHPEEARKRYRDKQRTLTIKMPWAGKTMTVKLPWVPSVNRMHSIGKGRPYRTKNTKEWIEKVQDLLGQPPENPVFPDERVYFTMEIYPPDKRRRDIDNLVKPCQDRFEGHWFTNDNQIDLLLVERKQQDEAKEGYVIITCGVINEQGNSLPLP